MMVVYGSGVNPDLEDLEDPHTWAQVTSSPQTSSDLPDPRVSVLIGRQADLETYNVFADEWTGKIVLPVVCKDVSANPSQPSDGNTHLLVIDLLKQI
jgi:hypothetical protein